MRTTLKRGVGRAAGLETRNGSAVFPPAPAKSAAGNGRVRLYRSPARPGRRVVGRVAVALALTLLAVALAVAGGAFLWFHESLASVKAHSPAVKKAEAQLDVSLPGHAAIALVLGYDQRAGSEFTSSSRSDTVMLIRADPVSKTISVLSIPRDLGVPIYCPDRTGSGMYATGEVTRINAAFADCGPAGTVDTVKMMTGLPINYLITVNFHGFKEIVDKLGGIWLDVDRRYYHVNNGTAAENYSNIDLEPGYQRLTGTQALEWVRYRHTDDDYHRIARQQEFVEALKQQFARNFDPLELPGIVSTITHNVEIGGDPSDRTVLGYLLFGLSLPGGHLFESQIAGVTGTGQTSTSAADIQASVDQFIHPNIAVVKAANAATLGIKPSRPANQVPPVEKTSVLVLNGNGVAGSALNGSYLLRERGYQTLLPPGNLEPNAPGTNYFDTRIYFDPHKQGAKAAAGALQKLIDPSELGPLPKSRALRALDPGAMLVVVLGETFHNALVPPAAVATTPAAPVQLPAHVRYDPGPSLALLRPFARRVPFPIELPDLLEASSGPDSQPGDVPARLYAIDKGHEAIRLVYVTGAQEFWGIEETNMPDPPVLDDRSFARTIKGRHYALYYNGSQLHMVVLRVGQSTYWVVNSLLNALSNKTMLAIAEGFRPLGAAK